MEIRNEKRLKIHHLIFMSMTNVHFSVSSIFFVNFYHATTQKSCSLDCRAKWKCIKMDLVFSMSLETSDDSP